MDPNTQFIQHRHNGADSQKIRLSDTEGDLRDIVTPSATISDPSGGVTVDTQARTAINAILDLLQAQGLMQ